jgi:hypothetical protein
MGVSLLPVEPVSLGVFMEQVVPALFRAVDLEPAEAAVALDVGVVLSGEGGGQWTLRFAGGELVVEGARREDVRLTLIQCVEDWRAPLWEGRPRLVAEAVDRVRAEGAAALRPPGGPTPGADFDPLKGLTDLRGRIDVVIEGAGESGGDWALGIHIGSGSVPAAAQATIRLGAAEAEAIRMGELHPLEALITGRLQLDGDLGLILQLQAVAMTLSAAVGSHSAG